MSGPPDPDSDTSMEAHPKAAWSRRRESRLLDCSLGAALHHREQFPVRTRAAQRVAVELEEGEGNAAIRALADQVVHYFDVFGAGAGPACPLDDPEQQ